MASEKNDDAGRMAWLRSRRFGLSLAAAIGLTIGIFLSKERIAEAVIIPALAKKAGYSLMCDFRKAGFSDSVATDIAIFRGDDSVQLSNLIVEYDLFDLISRREIRRLKIDGLSASLNWKEGGFRSGFFPAGTGSSTEAKPSAHPAKIDRIEVRNSQMELRFPGRTVPLTFDADADYDPIRGGYSINGRIVFCGNVVLVAGNWAPGQSSVSFSSSDFALSDLKGLPFVPEDMEASGAILFSISADSSKKNMRILARSRTLELEKNGIRVAASRDSECELEAFLGGDRCVVASLKRLGILKPVLATLDSAALSIGRAAENAAGKIEGKVEMRAEPGAAILGGPSGIRLAAPLVLVLESSGSLESDRSWKINIKPLLGGDSISIAAGAPESQVQFDLRQIQASIRGEGRGREASFNFACRSSTAVSGGKFSGTIPLLEFFGTLKSGGKTEVRAFAKLADSDFRLGALEMRDVSMLIPFEWPFPENRLRSIKGEKYELGSAELGGTSLGNISLGSGSSQIYQDGAGYVFAGTWNTPFEDFRLDLGGTVGFQGGMAVQLDLGTTDQAGEKKIEIGKISPGFPEIGIKGVFDISSRLGLSRGRASASANFAATQASIEYPAAKLAATGVKVEGQIRDLFNIWNSGPYRLFFSGLRKGKLEAADGEVELRLDSPGSTLVEKAECSFCGGRVYSSSFNLRKGEDFKVVLYCDRLKLPSLMALLGFGRADGDGTISGRIPLRLEGRRLRISDGFLYSAPGESGVISFSDVAALEETFRGNREAPNVQIAFEALKEFKYKWIRLGLDSAGDDIVVKMQIDGRPANVLPFGFDQNMSLARDPNAPGLRIEELLINMNFSLPSDGIAILNGINSKIVR